MSDIAQKVGAALGVDGEYLWNLQGLRRALEAQGWSMAITGPDGVYGSIRVEVSRRKSEKTFSWDMLPAAAILAAANALGIEEDS